LEAIVVLRVMKKEEGSDSKGTKEAQFVDNNEVSKDAICSVVWLAYSNGSFDKEMFSAYQECLKEKANNDKKDETEEENKVTDVVKECEYCKSIPCLLPYVYDEMMYLAEGMEDEAENKEIRHAMYYFVSKKLWGRLGCGFYKRIPHCIMLEIHDAYPAKKGTAYIGFKSTNDEGGKVGDTSD
jgi:hypothetical protein